MNDPRITPVNVSSPILLKKNWFSDLFRPHFDLWVIEPINRLVISDDALIGFVFMACAIDYLAGFWWGKSTKNNVDKAYTGFIDNYFPKGLYNPVGIYDSLRNGLVHLFTIKNKKYALTHHHPEIHLKMDINGQIVLNAPNFRDDLVIAKDNYFNEVINDENLLNKVIERYKRDGFMASGNITIHF